ncbi:Mo-dependent nitrogenase C-terminal domain-containing protein [Leptolyngbya sp. 'hensonii']|uniref:Mo-dependent nitrogenase C-terminal domain-containing protein n=1 Tax=Leptolyngbya sp. 'hensonii' TaxID=1922337 RepID=UPI00209B7C90|nr:Mo-dependent nitrogenase C-terminal domain-containing protein [Leptolyngbya sp. 'hensonii']
MSTSSTENIALVSWIWIQPGHILNQETHASSHPSIPHSSAPELLNVLQPLRQWLNEIDVRDLQRAHFICKSIPSQCPFARDIKFFGKTLLSIPPLCKLNPLYEEVVALRFRALCYLADECGEDITAYC